MHITESFSIHTEEDKDIIKWLDAQDNKSKAIRKAIRAYIGDGGITLADIYVAVMALKRQGISVVNKETANKDEAEAIDEPTDAAANLDGLLKR